MEHEVLSHWCTIVENFELSPVDFYKIVEQSVARRKVPGLDIWRVQHREGGILSANRIYLRLERERLWFDICGAPFGTGFFFSSWFVRRIVKATLFDFVALLVGLAALAAVIAFKISPAFALVAVGMLLLVTIMLMRNAVRFNIETTLLGMPIIGPIYETYFCPATYYRIDTMQMYQEVVQMAVIDAVNEVTTQKGLKPLTELECKPVLSEVLRK